MCICGLWNIMKMSSCKRKTKQKTCSSQLAYKHRCKLVGCWSLGIMEYFPWMQIVVPMCRVTTFSSLMVFDHHRQGLPIAWVITSWQRKLDLIHWLLTLKECTLKEDPTYSLSCFIKDDAS